MNTLESLTIECSWCGRHGDSVKVVGASSKEEARKAAFEFAELPSGITLDEGRLQTWGYDEPRPADWQDYYVFWSCDEHPVDQREWWEK